ncbi:MAG: hypothetical protein R3F15_18125 [Lysobacterales bacterium]
MKPEKAGKDADTRSIPPSAPVRRTIWAACGVCAALLVGCGNRGEPLAECESPRELRAVLDTHWQPAEAKAAIESGLTPSRQMASPYFQAHGFKSADGRRAPVPVVRPMPAPVPVPADILLSGSVDSLWVFAGVPLGDSFQSSRYYGEAGAVPYRADFAIRIDPVNEGMAARITVRSFNSTLFHGTEFNAHALGFVPSAIRVDPVREEEYLVLQYIGHLLGNEIPPLATVRREAGISCGENTTDR